MNFDRDIKEGIERLQVASEGKDWSRMESMLNEIMPVSASALFDRDIKEKVAEAEGASQPDWSRMSQTLDNELGQSGNNFDNIIAAKVLQFDPEKNANWDKMSQALDRDAQPGKSMHMFDREIKRALVGLVAAVQPRWNDMSFALDADPVLGDPQAFDSRIKEEIEHTEGAGQASSSWPRMEQHLLMQGQRRRQILRSKFAEMAAVLLLLLSFPGLFTLFNQGEQEQTIRSVEKAAPDKHNATQKSISALAGTNELTELNEPAGQANDVEGTPQTSHQKAEEKTRALPGSNRASFAGANDGGALEPVPAVDGNAQEMTVPVIDKRADEDQVSDQSRAEAEDFQSLAFVVNTDLDADKQTILFPPFQSVESKRRGTHRTAPLLYLSAQAQFRHYEILIPGLSGSNRLIYKNQVQPGMAIGLTSGVWDLELGVFPFQLEHNGLPGQQTFVDYPEDEATFRREYKSSRLEGLVVPLRGRYHMPVTDRFYLHALAGLNGTFLSESEQVFPEEFHEWSNNDNTGGNNLPDRVDRFNDSNFFLDAELGLGVNYRLNPRWRVFAEGSTYIPLGGIRAIGENADEYSQHGLSIGFQFLLK